VKEVDHPVVAPRQERHRAFGGERERSVLEPADLGRGRLDALGRPGLAAREAHAKAAAEPDLVGGRLLDQQAVARCVAVVDALVEEASDAKLAGRAAAGEHERAEQHRNK
jgi:hypothetical protein